MLYKSTKILHKVKVVTAKQREYEDLYDRMEDVDLYGFALKKIEVGRMYSRLRWSRLRWKYTDSIYKCDGTMEGELGECGQCYRAEEVALVEQEVEKIRKD